MHGVDRVPTWRICDYERLYGFGSKLWGVPDRNVFVRTQRKFLQNMGYMHARAIRGRGRYDFVEPDLFGLSG
ncbi:MAG: hypothetical protein BWY17_04948 [Deltaproteobacteria bacterium ADurb.Bin207]|nr:MAG: hypothetical protein BWY17_04948 [Deltaproteobacteria bacterium ADurb.Bin207]